MNNCVDDVTERSVRRVLVTEIDRFRIPGILYLLPDYGIDTVSRIDVPEEHANNVTVSTHLGDGTSDNLRKVKDQPEIKDQLPCDSSSLRHRHHRWKCTPVRV